MRTLLKHGSKYVLLVYYLMTVILLDLHGNALACGKERWAVKVATDNDVGLVSASVVDTSIAKLINIDAPADPDSRPYSRFKPVETTIFHITGKLVFIKRERDQDYHLVIQDPIGRTMIIEAPSPACAQGSQFYKEILTVRRQINRRYQLRYGARRLNDPVSVTGIAFFDRIHGQDGVAPNGLELHPILSLKFQPTNQ